MHLSPTETAARFGVSIKALRLYEQRGLLTPLRSEAGWRTYGPDQIARLHQILALKRLGLPLAKIGALLAGPDALEPVLALQEQVLARDSEQLSRALALVRSARAKLKAGQALSIDDLATLNQETVMNSPSIEETRALFDKTFAQHFTPQECEAIRKNRAAVMDDWMELKPQLLAAMAAGDPTTPAARDVARRCRAISMKVTAVDGASPERFRVFRDEIAKDPKISGMMAATPEMISFVKQALAGE
jgi:DNA-binding transcriptional MerR regulator